MSAIREVLKTTETKAFRAEVKADAPPAGATTGEFEALVAAFGNVDLQGDRLEPEAFDATKAAWTEAGDPIPVLWSHQWDDPMAHIGYVRPEDLEATPDGLKVRGTIDLSTDLAKQVHRLMVDRRVKEFSFAYLPTDAEPDPEDADVRVLRSVDLIEVGPTLKGANPETVLYGAKSATAPHETGTSEEAWDGPANEARLPSSEAALSAAHAWRDPEGDPDAKATYKFIHHEVAEDGRVGSANLTACSSAIAVLNGGRGGSNIPDDDRAGVHAHLGKHLGDADREVPELAAYEDDETQKVPEPEPEPVPEPEPEGDKAAADAEAKTGRVLSKKNETKLRDAGALISEVLASLGESAASDEAGDGEKRSANRGGAAGTDRMGAELRILDVEGLP